MRHLSICLAWCFFVTVVLAGNAAVITCKATKLNNGIPVILVRTTENPVVSLTVVMGVGLRCEHETNNGVSHLLEHLTFNGTQTRSQEELYHDLDRAGCYSNASTGDDYTAYYFLVSKENFKRALEIQFDMLFHSTLPEEKIGKEKDIVIQEIRKAQMRPSFEESGLLHSILFHDNVYRMRVIGNKASLDGINRIDIQHFYQKYYLPANAKILVVGDFDETLVMSELNRKLADLPQGRVENKTIAVSIPTFGKIKKVPSEGMPFDVFYRVFQIGKMTSTHFPAQEVAVALLDRSLKQAFKDVDPNISCSSQYTLDYGMMEIRARLKQDTVDVDAFNRQLTAFLSNYQATQTGVASIATRMKDDVLFSLERPHFFGMLFAPKMAAGLTDPFYMRSVTVADVNEFLNRLAKRDSQTAILIQQAKKVTK